ncbi:MAG: hypothetical protein PHV13_02980 [Candidatus ainarchaeum sp.]|nr:hypothetical protein [Candidatus ainarchaeum sp.]
MSDRNNAIILGAMGQLAELHRHPELQTKKTLATVQHWRSSLKKHMEEERWILTRQ